MGVPSFYCPNIDDITLQGDEFSGPYSFYNFWYARCRGSSWVTDVESLNNYFEDRFLTIYVVESYYDADDLNEPVKQFISTDNQIPLSNSFSTTMDMYVRENEVRLLNGTVKTFYDVGQAEVHSK